VVVSVVGNEQRGTLLSAQEVLQKPVSREALLRVLQPFLQPRVLLIEDNDDDRRLMGAHLAGAALEVRVAESGPEALSLLESFLPDLILLDLMMPRMDGMTFLARLRKDPRFASIPVVVVTARDLTPAEQRRLSAEAHAILRKSNDWGEDLRRLLPQLLRADSSPPGKAAAQAATGGVAAEAGAPPDRA
jgi:CheY-like chemotaxis protein